MVRRLTAAFAALACAGVAAPVLATPARAAQAPVALAAPARASAQASPCAAIASGRVAGLRGRPLHVTFALASRYGSNQVTVTECTRTRSGRYVASWSTPGRVGTKGFAPAGAKREGDGRSPTGVYALGPAFGARNPGSRVGYLRLRPNSCWGSTVGSKRYNRYFLGRCGPKDEAMYDYVRGAYRQGMVIGYNTSPIRQGRGSAIFLHVGTGGATAGCVSMPLAKVTAKIRNTRRGDVMVMGVSSAVLRRA